MAKNENRTPREQASILYTHAPRTDGFRAPEYGDAERIQAIETHVAQRVAPAVTVFHEIISATIHLDVHAVPPGTGHPYWFLFTTGMSALPMHMPEGVEACPFAEVSVLLPPTWKVDQEFWSDERWYWPTRCIKTLARLPHDYNTWLGWGHTVPNGQPPQPFDPSTRLAAMLLLPSLTLGVDALKVRAKGVVVAELWTLYPLHADELEFKLQHGTDALVDLFEARNVGDVIDPERPSVIPVHRRKLLGLF
ncbi:suppressor of fused domain protein [Nannocystis bainbridge]|uniref:Suppressor of fused domain protein n=1 Tax=Nannocystis bainbridge TaxID=2995303 RepID=A0ABT5DR50_9BACT|nr:suppressor of fused domain protein [Nannocystis bainbridge]MDC0716129.1 suppressor of fused domain protein [Nannocystis bainbridge]